MKHWLENSGKLGLLWISSDKSSFSEELFHEIFGLGSEYSVDGWRCYQSNSSEAILNRKGAWSGFEGHVSPAEFKLLAKYETHAAVPPRVVNAVLGAGSLNEPMSANAAELFEDHRSRGDWSFGVQVRKSSDSGDLVSLLAFTAWLDSKLSDGQPRLSGEVVERMMLSIGSEGLVVLPAYDADMKRGVVCAGNPSLVNRVSKNMPVDRLITKAQADLRGWRAAFGL